GDAVRPGRQRGITGRSGAKRIESCGEMSVAPNRFGEIDGADDDGNVRGGRCAWTGDVGVKLRRGPRLERVACRRIDRFGVLPVTFIELENVSGVHSLERSQCHNLSILPRPTAVVSGFSRTAGHETAHDSTHWHRRRWHAARQRLTTA